MSRSPFFAGPAFARPLAAGLAAALVLGAGVTATARTDSVQAVIEAERAFARAANDPAIGVDAAFRSAIAEDGVLFRPDPVRGAAWMAAQPVEPPQTGLAWWPVYAGVAASGDLGFTTGPWKVGDRGGYYLTIWRKQADGRWKFVLDHGPRLQPSPLGPDAPVEILPAALSAGQLRAGQWPGSGAGGIEEVKGLDDALAAAARVDLKAAFAPLTAPDTRMMGATGGGQPAVGAEAVAAELARRPRTVAYARLGADISAANDLAYTYGNADWSGADGKPARGHYVRIWQKRPGGWKLVIDEIVPAPPRAAA